MFIEGLSRLAEVALLFSCFGLLFVACTGDSKATPFSLGAPISIGPYEVIVSHMQWEVDSVIHSIGPEEIGMVVFVSWTGLESLDRNSQLTFIKNFNENRISLLDSAGNKYRPRYSATVDVYMWYQQSGRDLAQLQDLGQPRDWVVWFTVPRESQNFTLIIKNPDPQEGQPRLAAVLLGQ